jgi:NAD(P)-dependent dehydrogenase (short-subunit alcohol dehydrogenase family)
LFHQKQTNMKQTNYNGVLQQPLNSGFNATSTAQDTIQGTDLTGRIAIVTGGYAGIGLETTKTFAAAGATVIVPVRDPQKAQKNLQGIKNVELEALDLMNPTSIDAFAKKFIDSDRPLHLLINNAGIMWVPLRRDSRGYESQLSTNHLGHFQLTARLWPALKRAKGARVVNVSSYGHHTTPFNFEDPNFNHREYHTLEGYGQSKTANNLFTVELDSRCQVFDVRAYAVHPGAVGGTDLGREADIELFKQIGIFDEDGNMKPEVAIRLKAVPQGAATSVWCATSPLLSKLGGVYCEDGDIAELDLGNIEHKLHDPRSMRAVKPYSLDQKNAKQLWTLSEEMTGVIFRVD